jgi:hypothetical protein
MSSTTKDFLASVPVEEIRGLYSTFGAPPYTGAADERVAEHLTIRARAKGLEVEIPGTTMGRFRSTIGLVRAPRPAPAAPSPSPAEPLLPGFGDHPAALAILEGIRKQAERWADAAWATYFLLKTGQAVAPEARPNGSEAALHEEVQG